MPDYTDNPGYVQPSPDEPENVGNSQLSDEEGAFSDVSSVALNPGLLGAASKGKQSTRANGKLPPGAENLTDADLMLRVKDGDDSAFEYLAEKYRRPMLGFMYRVTRNTHLAEELAQEVFLRVYRARATYNAEAKFSTWLYRIASNLSVNY